MKKYMMCAIMSLTLCLGSGCTTTTEIAEGTGILYGITPYTRINSSVSYFDAEKLDSRSVRVELQGRGLSTYEDSNGYWAFRVPEGIYTVVISAPHLQDNVTTNVQFLGRDSLRCEIKSVVHRYRYGKIRVDTLYYTDAQDSIPRTVWARVHAYDVEGSPAHLSAQFSIQGDTTSAGSFGYQSTVVPLDTLFSYPFPQSGLQREYWSVWLMEGMDPLFDTTYVPQFTWNASLARTPIQVFEAH